MPRLHLNLACVHKGAYLDLQAIRRVGEVLDVLFRQVLEFVNLALSKCQTRACMTAVAWDLAAHAVAILSIMVTVAVVIAAAGSSALLLAKVDAELAHDAWIGRYWSCNVGSFGARLAIRLDVVGSLLVVQAPSLE
jgi:hypothetical protein